MYRTRIEPFHLDLCACLNTQCHLRATGFRGSSDSKTSIDNSGGYGIQVEVNVVITITDDIGNSMPSSSNDYDVNSFVAVRSETVALNARPSLCIGNCKDYVYIVKQVGENL